MIRAILLLILSTPVLADVSPQRPSPRTALLYLRAESGSSHSWIFDVNSGRIKWTVESKDHLFVFSTRFGYLVKVPRKVEMRDPETGAVRWASRKPFDLKRLSTTFVYGVDGNDLVALELATGFEAWRVKDAGRFSHLAPGRVLCVRDTLYSAYDAVSGIRLWTLPLREGEVQIGNTILLGPAGLRSINLETGEIDAQVDEDLSSILPWTGMSWFDEPYGILCAEAGPCRRIDPVTLRTRWVFKSMGEDKEMRLNYIGTWDGKTFVSEHACGRVYALNYETGQVLWECDVPKKFYPRYTRGYGILGCANDRIVAIDPRTGQLTWTVLSKEIAVLWSDSRFAFVSTKGEIQKRRVSDGKIMWSQSTPGRPWILADYVLVSDERSLVCLSWSTGKILWRIPLDAWVTWISVDRYS